FFASARGDPRSLHSFPTRRSSDLIFVDSAGTHAYHIGEPPDRRAQNSALKRGYSMCDLRARKVTVSDFTDFHYILAMDYENLARSEEHTSELQSRENLVCRLLLEK